MEFDIKVLQSLQAEAKALSSETGLRFGVDLVAMKVVCVGEVDDSV